MSLARVKPISFVKANAAEIIAGFAEGDGPMIVTQNGEAKAVLQDLRGYQETQETLALLKILALGQREIAQDGVRPAVEVFATLRARHRD